eukprot:1834239-Amphidinium_carterae.1
MQTLAWYSALFLHDWVRKHCWMHVHHGAGFTRDGHCQDLGNDDAGSHHICITMRSALRAER